jgi:hypothetical protein
MAKNSRRAEQLELDYRPRRIPDWKFLPVGVREEVFEALTRMFRNRFEQPREVIARDCIAIPQQVVRELLRVQRQQLPTESQVVEDEVLPGTESADQPSRGNVGATRS